jgi:hypothetical protein
MLCGIGSVKIAGVDVTDKVTRLTITESINEPTSCSIETAIDPIWENNAEPTPFADLEVKDDDGVIVFGGQINLQPQRIDEVSGSRYSIRATDWSAEAGLRFVDDHFAGWTASDVYRVLVEKYLPDHLTTDVCENDTEVNLKFSGQTVTQCFKTLCDLTQWCWRVKPDKSHYFGPQFVETLQTLITDEHADTSKGSTTRFEKDYSTLANRVWVEGGEAPAQRKTKQFVAFSDLQATEKSEMALAYPLMIPVWYRCQEIEAYAVFDSGDGLLENGKQVRINCSSNQKVANQTVQLPTDQTVGIDHVRTYLYGQDQNLTVTGQSSHVVIPDFDCIHLEDADDGAKGGHIYISKGTVSVMQRMNGQGLVSGVGYFYTNPDLEKETTKMLGFLITYRRLMKISYVSEIDTESVEKYGVQIDLPKVVKPAIKDWTVLYRYADFLLASHKDPPSKGMLTLWRYKNGQKVFGANIKAGWLISFNLERFGQASSVKVTKVVHSIEPHCWRMAVHSSLDPNLYQSLFADILRRVTELELERSSGNDVINSVRKVSQTQGISLARADVSTVDPDDYGFDSSDFGTSEWEG